MMKNVNTKMPSMFFLIVVIVAVNWFGAAADVKILSNSDIPENEKNVDRSGEKYTAIENDTFLNRKKIVKLLLARNQLRELPEHGFSPLTKLKKLDLNHNLISNVKNAFYDLGNLELLDLGHNSLKVVGTNFFVGLTGKCKITMKHNKFLHKIQGDAFGGEFPEPNEHIAAGDSVREKDNYSKSLSKPTNVQFEACYDLGDFVSLKVQGKRALKFCDDVIFDNQILNLNMRSIGKVARGWFRVPVENLLDANISGFNIIGVQLIEVIYAIIKELPPTIKKLVLEEGQMDKLMNYTFSSEHIVEIVLDRNGIYEIESGAFVMPNLISLNLDGNYLRDIRFVNQLPNTLEVLSLGSNEIEKIEMCVPRRHLLNRLVGPFPVPLIPPFQHLPNLITLDLSKNNINVIANGVFGGLKNLRVLLLNGNKLKRIGTKLFVDLPRLVDLNLARNDIETIGERMFRKSKDLCRLYLAGNPIRGLGNGALFGLQKKSSCYVTVDGTYFDTLMGGVFDDVP